jgi:hypothetical protein
MRSKGVLLIYNFGDSNNNPPPVLPQRVFAFGVFVFRFNNRNPETGNWQPETGNQFTTQTYTPRL